MRAAIFIVYLAWTLCMLAVFLPAAIAIAIASAAINLARIVVRTALRVLTFGVFK